VRVCRCARRQAHPRPPPSPRAQDHPAHRRWLKQLCRLDALGHIKLDLSRFDGDRTEIAQRDADHDRVTQADDRRFRALDAERRQGLSPREAIEQACLLRFRPILMTTLCALLGALPLMLGNGVGSELRQPLGVTLVGGLIVSQWLTLFTTPVIYLLLERWSKARQWSTRV
jgi:hypothetical protein